jgi:hypothetical protein
MTYEIIGQSPDIVGKICDEIIIESFFNDEQEVSSVNVIFFKFSDVWHRLCFEPPGVVFWRIVHDEPSSWSVPEQLWTYPHFEISAGLGLTGKMLGSYVGTPTEHGCKLLFRFFDGSQFIVALEGELVSYSCILDSR